MECYIYIFMYISIDAGESFVNDTVSSKVMRVYKIDIFIFDVLKGKKVYRETFARHFRFTFSHNIARSLRVPHRWLTDIFITCFFSLWPQRDVDYHTSSADVGTRTRRDDSRHVS